MAIVMRAGETARRLVRARTLAILVSLATLALAAGGCFDPTFPDGKIACKVSADCPSGLACNAGLCFHLDQEDGAVLPGTGAGGASGHDGGTVAGHDGGGAAGRGGSGGIAGAAGASAGRDGGEATGDGGCAANLCAVGDHRCGPNGLDTCVAVGNCTTWSADVACGGRQTCQGDAPSAACRCPAAPIGCTGAGNSCVGGALVTCAVDGDQCVYPATTTTCPTSEPCGGAFPNAVCTCPAKPAACTTGQPGTFCDSTGKALVTCSLDANKCLVATAPSSCAQPCTGAAGSVTCGSCPTPPVECTRAGTLCDSSGRLETCGADPSTGCLGKTSVAACGSPQTCQGTLPSAACVCPAAPAICLGQTGTVCSSAGSNMVVTCASVNGCLTATPSKTCPSPQSCTGSLPSAACSCPTVAACQSGSSGSYCDTSNGNLVTCTQDSNSCFSAASNPCPTGLVCSGSFPSGKCICPSVPGCPTTGTSCNSMTLVSCTKDGMGCFHEADTNCATSGLVCSSTGTVAACSCPAPTNGCGSSAGKSCAGDATVLICSASAQGCIQGTTSACSTGQYCWTSTSACALPTAVGYATDLGGMGNRSAGNLLGQSITLTATSTVRSFGLLVPGPGSMVSMGLYTDMAGSPYQLVAQALSKAVLNGTNVYPAAPATSGGSLQLPAGTYWIMAIFDQTTAVKTATTGGATTTVKYVSQGFGPLPQTLSGVLSQPGQLAANYYISVTQ
jgi:hypothetical protein